MYLIEKTTPGDGYRIWYLCERKLKSQSSTESSREDSEDEVAVVLLVRITLIGLS